MRRITIFAQEIGNLLRDGKLHIYPRYTILKSLKDSFVIFLFSYIFNILIGITIIIISRSFGIIIPKNKAITDLFNINITSVFFTVTIIAPMFEEILFRISLKYSLLNLTLMLTFIFYLLSGLQIFKIENILNSNTRIILSIYLGLLFYTSICASIKISFMIEKFWIKYSKFIFYFSLLSFGFSHLFNYSINSKLLLYSPLFTLSQIFSGIILGYVRLKYGVIYSFLIHSAKNTVSVLTAIALTHN